jgi:photosystem II stability/assembly factor-like uncharacterized protein
MTEGLPNVVSAKHGFARPLYACVVLTMSLLLTSFAKPADDWAPLLPRARDSLLLDITRAGSRLVVVGDRGHVLYSDDEGQQWTQARVPGRQMLTSVFFIDERTGWAAGHDGVIMQSIDGGANWAIQRNGLKHQVLLNEDSLAATSRHLQELRSRQQANPELDLSLEIEDAEFDLEDAQSLQQQPVFAPPLMDIWFADPNRGWAVGAYGTLLATTDGGHNWHSQKRRLKNPDELHHNAVTGTRDGRILIAGESGGMFRSNNYGADWESLASPHYGSWFGALYLPQLERVLVFGLQGKAFYSDDFGASWQPARTNTSASLAGGHSDGHRKVILAGSVGRIIGSVDGGASFAPLPQRMRDSISAVSRNYRGDLVTVGMGGIDLLPAASGGDSGDD